MFDLVFCLIVGLIVLLFDLLWLICGWFGFNFGGCWGCLRLLAGLGLPFALVFVGWLYGCLT